MLLEVKNLKTCFFLDKGIVRVVGGVDFEVRRSQTLGIVGKSGCGKTTTARVILRAYEPTSGKVLFKTRNGEWVNIPELDRKQLRQLRQEMQMIFQDPHSSLNLRMYVGKLVEIAETEELLMNPKHPYTEALLSAVPKPDPRMRRKRIVLPGEVADPTNPPSGCYFHPHCRYARPICREEGPILREIAPGHFVSCHLAEELSLAGVMG